MEINEKKLAEALAKRGLKQEDVNLVFEESKSVEVKDDPKQGDPKEEKPAEDNEEEPKQEGGEPTNPVEDKKDPDQEGHGDNGGEPLPESKPGTAEQAKITALEDENDELKGLIDGLTAKFASFESIVLKHLGIPVANGSQRDVGDKAHIEGSDVVKTDFQAEWEKQRKRAGGNK